MYTSKTNSGSSQTLSSMISNELSIALVLCLLLSGAEFSYNISFHEQIL